MPFDAFSTDTFSLIVDSKCAEIDKAIRQLYGQIQELKARRNSLAAISQLPPELLLRIFSFVQAQLFKDDLKRYYRWTAITHVSQQWRDVAIGQRSLWSGIIQC
ncbi:hypothetical protein BDN72DRAFT_771317, partial [Pluteus cervinus]